MEILLPYRNTTFSVLFLLLLFCVQNLCCNDSKYHSLNWKDDSITNVDIFEKKQFSLQFFYSLLQVYIVHRVSFIFHLNVFLVSVCARGFGYLLCWPRGRGIGLTCTRRFSFHEFYNFLLFIFLILIFFGRLFFITTTFTHDPRPLPTTHDPRHLATLLENHPYDRLSWLAVLRFLELWERRDMSINLNFVAWENNLK